MRGVGGQDVLALVPCSTEEELEVIAWLEDMWRQFHDSKNNQICSCGRGFKRFQHESECMYCILDYIHHYNDQ